MTGEAPVFTCSIPVQVVSEANQREHWAKKHKRKLDQQGTAFMMLTSKISSVQAPHLGAKSIHLTRVIANRGRSMDTDNLAGSFKHVQDAIAFWLGVDDGKLRWTYSQKRGHAAAVEVEVWNF